MRCRSRHIALSFALLLGLLAHASDTIRFDQIDTITAYSIDVKGNHFLSDGSGTLYKFDQKGKEVTRVNSKVYGAIHSIDCSNPFELYVYHKEQNVVVFYDNMLNTRSVLALNEHGLTNVQAIARSFDNNLWLFDNNGFELKKIDKKGQLMLSSGNITAFIHLNVEPIQIIEDGQKVYVADPLAGILVFDLFGTYLSHMGISPIIHMDISKGNVYALQADKLIHRDPRSLEKRTIPLNGSFSFINSFRDQLFGVQHDFVVRIL